MCLNKYRVAERLAEEATWDGGHVEEDIFFFVGREKGGSAHCFREKRGNTHTTVQYLMY